MGLVYLASSKPTDAILVCSQILIGLGGAVSVTSSYMAVQASVPHQDMGIAVAVLNLWSSMGSSIAIAISSSVWNKKLPANLNTYLGATHNATEILDIYGSIYIAREAEPRELVKKGKF
jgi:nitrate/nitrite transporter NarK